MTIAVGSKLPEGSIKQVTPEGTKDVTATDYFGGRKIVLFAVPGAFTPTCSNNHLPGFVENRDAILAKGVDAIAVLAVNDPFVMGAWSRFTGAEGKIDFLADGGATFTKALGLDIDLTGGGMGVRSRRYSMLVEDGVVKQLNIEETPGKAETSGAATLLGQL